MVHTLLLRISSAWQSWGMQSNFAVRDSGREPTKSGIVGLLCAALGRDRAEPLDDLQALRMGVRVDQTGVLYRDFHTAQAVYRASGGIKPTEPSSRYYLADARFLVGLESNDLVLLQKVHTALRAPCWVLYLGRKACLPDEPVWLRDGLQQNTSLLEALQVYPWLGCTGERPEYLSVLVEDPQGEIERPDQPLSFAERRFTNGRLRRERVETPIGNLEDNLCTFHA